MAINVKCPKCGSSKVQLSNEESKKGCMYFLFLGWIYLIWVMIKWVIGLMLFVMYDWWMAIIKIASGKGHIWQCKKWFSGRRKIYYCHECGLNFRA